MAPLHRVALLLLLVAACKAQTNQAEILLKQKAAITNWAAFSSAAGLAGWDASTPVCEWTGVSCDGVGDVSALNMSCTQEQPRFCGVRAEGRLAPELCQISSLTSIMLGNHSLSGPLPEEWGSPGACKHLSNLFVNDNKLTGSLPASWAREGSMPNLLVASLGNNQFSGTLPDNWAAMPALVILALPLNQLTGTLPNSWGYNGSWPNLGRMDLGGNRLSGTLPASWGTKGAFQNLDYLAMCCQKLSGPLPDAWASPDALPQLEKLYVNNNTLSGKLPSSWGNPLAFRQLFGLWIAVNNFTGPIPASWADPGAFIQLSVLELYGMPELCGPVPENIAGAVWDQGQGNYIENYINSPTCPARPQPPSPPRLGPQPPMMMNLEPPIAAVIPSPPGIPSPPSGMIQDPTVPDAASQPPAAEGPAASAPPAPPLDETASSAGDPSSSSSVPVGAIVGGVVGGVAFLAILLALLALYLRRKRGRGGEAGGKDLLPVAVPPPPPGGSPEMHHAEMPPPSPDGGAALAAKGLAYSGELDTFISGGAAGKPALGIVLPPDGDGSAPATPTPTGPGGGGAPAAAAGHGGSADGSPPPSSAENSMEGAEPAVIEEHPALAVPDSETAFPEDELAPLPSEGIRTQDGLTSAGYSSTGEFDSYIKAMVANNLWSISTGGSALNTAAGADGAPAGAAAVAAAAAGAALAAGGAGSAANSVASGTGSGAVVTPTTAAEQPTGTPLAGSSGESSQPHSLEEDRLLAAISSRLGSTGQQESAGGGGGDVAEHALSADVQQWRVDWRDIKLERVVGGGSFGKVYLGTWKETQVAVKLLVQEPGFHGEVADLELPADVARRLQKEAGVMSGLRHPHLVTFLGLCTMPPCILTEYCTRGSLLTVLRRASRDRIQAAELTWKLRLRMALDAGLAMLYLHTRTPSIIHRDIKSPNLLVDEAWRVKVSDFNLSKILLEHDAVKSASLGASNPIWLAPEVLRGEKATAASDVFSFALVLFELLTWQLPWADVPTYTVTHIVINGGRPEVPPWQQLPGPDTAKFVGLSSYVRLMRECWQQRPEDRPTFAEIVPRLRELLEEMP
ncbi:hypothetical protein ABPG77_003278 [Micractinium sp. CCAP 211/92]